MSDEGFPDFVRQEDFPNIEDAVERLRAKLAVAVKALEDIKFCGVNGNFHLDSVRKIADQALAEIGEVKK